MNITTLPKPVATFKRTDLENIMLFLNYTNLPMETTFEVVDDEGNVSLFYKHLNWGLLLKTTEYKNGGELTIVYDSLYAGLVKGDIKMKASVTIREGDYHFFSLKQGNRIITEPEVAKETSDEMRELALEGLLETSPDLLEKETPVELGGAFANRQFDITDVVAIATHLNTESNSLFKVVAPDGDNFTFLNENGVTTLISSVNYSEGEQVTRFSSTHRESIKADLEVPVSGTIYDGVIHLLNHVEQGGDYQPMNDYKDISRFMVGVCCSVMQEVSDVGMTPEQIKEAFANKIVITQLGYDTVATMLKI